MANRTVKTSLVAEVSGYLSGFDQAARKTRELGSETEKLGQKREAIAGVGTAMTAFGAVAVATVGLVAARYAEFDAAMSKVQAATHASAGEMSQLRDAAIDAGAKTVYSATEAAGAIEELSKAGVQTNEILNGGLAGALDLASAGELKVADAAQIAATAMTQFGLRGSEVPHVADLLSAGAGKAQGSVQDLSAALNQGGLVASQAGFNINETTGTLAAFASAGLLGSDAGTSLKTAILALQNPSTTAAATMKQYGLDVYDSTGQMLSFGGIAAQLKDKLGTLSDEQRNAALAQIFGNDAVRAANVLYSEGAGGIAEWTGKVNDQGYAAETARLKLDNLKGDVEKLGGSFDTALIQSGSAANGVLRNLTQSATFLVDVIGDTPAPILAAGAGLTALAGGTLLVGGAALGAVPKFAAFKAQLDTMGISMKTAALRTVGLSAGIGAAAVGIGLLVSMQAQAEAATDELTDTLDKQTGALTKYSRAAVAKRLADGGEFEAARKAGVTQRELTDAVLQGGAALEKVQGKLGDRNTFGGMFTGAAYEAGWAQQNIANVANSVQDAKQKFNDQKKANAEAGNTAMTVAEQYKEEASNVSDLTSELNDLVEKISAANDVNQDAISANASYQEALAGLAGQVAEQRKSTEGYTTSLDENTSIGANNASMLSDLADKAQTSAKAQFDVDQSTMGAKAASEKYASTLAEQRRKFIESATAAGFNAGEVKKLADRVFQLPSAKEIKLLADTKQAQVDLNAFITRNDGRVITVRQQLITEAIKSGAAPGAAKAAYNANGAVMDFYGDGGVAENHVAQFAAAGTMRVWAEPETGGEAYIPLAASKRTRSLAIWEETGRRLQAFADGDVRGGTPTYVPTPPQIVYAQQAQPISSEKPWVYAPQFVSSGSQRRDQDESQWVYQRLQNKQRGGR